MDVIKKMLSPTLSLALGICIALSLFNFPVLQTLWRHSFDDGTYSHAFLIPFISVYLFYILDKNNLLKFRKELSIPIISITVLVALLFFMSVNAQLSLGYWTTFLILLNCCLLVVFKFNWYLLFPGTYLVFLFPLWGTLSLTLQDISVVASSFFMSFTGISYYVDAPYIQIPSGTFEIANGCSGLRYLIVSLAISSLYIFLFIKNTKKAALFFTIAVLGGLLTNWIRITALIIIGHMTEMEHSLMTDHNSFGWYLFMPFMIGLFFLGNKLSDHDLTRQEVESDRKSLPHSKSILVVSLLMLVTSTTVPMFFKSPTQSDDLTALKDLPNIEYYSSVTVSKSLNSFNLTYYFDASDLDSKPTFFNNKIIPKGWRVVDTNHTKEVLNYKVRSMGRMATISASYQLGEQKFANSKSLKIARLKQALFGKQELVLNWSISYCKIECAF